MRQIRKALDKGLISERRSAALLDLTTEQMTGLLETYGLASEAGRAAADGA